MNCAQIRRYDIANGEGIRVSVFISGCTHGCYNCFNPEYQDFGFGEPWTPQTTRIVAKYLADPVIAGLTVLGGEPFQSASELAAVLRDLRESGVRNIWIYSGYTFEEIVSDPAKLELLRLCDILVDGRYIDAERDVTLRFRGSRNQRILDVARSLESGATLHYAEDGRA